MRFRMVGLFVVSVLAFSLVACGSPLDNSGVPPEKPMEDLTKEEQTKLSNAVMDAVFSEDNIKVSCQLSAYGMAGTRGEGKAQCETALKTCDTFAANKETYAAGLQQQFESCKGVTVQQWTACMKVMIRYFNELKPVVNSHSCEKPLDFTSLFTHLSAETLKDYTTKCQGVMSKCGSVDTRTDSTEPPPTPTNP